MHATVGYTSDILEVPRLWSFILPHPNPDLDKKSEMLARRTMLRVTPFYIFFENYSGEKHK